MKSLLIVAHGSRRAASNESVSKLARQVATLDNQFNQVQSAFLEIVEPSIPEGIIRLIKAGADEVVILPYFLTAGRHVVEDVPAEVAKAQEQHPNINLQILPHLGDTDLMPFWLNAAASPSTD